MNKPYFLIRKLTTAAFVLFGTMSVGLALNRVQLNDLRENAKKQAPQLFDDLNNNFAWSWNNYFRKMMTAVTSLAEGDEYNAMQFLKQAQEGNPNVQQEFDTGLQDYGEVFWLILLSAAPGQFTWSDVDTTLNFTKTNNIGGLQNADTYWGPNADGPPDLKTTLRAVACLLQASFIEQLPTGPVIHLNVIIGALRGAFLADCGNLFSLVHKYLPAPATN